jgi:hypothetical protein
MTVRYNNIALTNSPMLGVRMKWKQDFNQSGRLTFNLRGGIFIGRFVTDRVVFRKFRAVSYV